MNSKLIISVFLLFFTFIIYNSNAQVQILNNEALKKMKKAQKEELNEKSNSHDWVVGIGQASDIDEFRAKEKAKTIADANIRKFISGIEISAESDLKRQEIGNQYKDSYKSTIKEIIGKDGILISASTFYSESNTKKNDNKFYATVVRVQDYNAILTPIKNVIKKWEINWKSKNQEVNNFYNQYKNSSNKFIGFEKLKDCLIKISEREAYHESIDRIIAKHKTKNLQRDEGLLKLYNTAGFKTNSIIEEEIESILKVENIKNIDDLVFHILNKFSFQINSSYGVTFSLPSYNDVEVFVPAISESFKLKFETNAKNYLKYMMPSTPKASTPVNAGALVKYRYFFSFEYRKSANNVIFATKFQDTWFDKEPNIDEIIFEQNVMSNFAFDKPDMQTNKQKLKKNADISNFFNNLVYSINNPTNSNKAIASLYTKLPSNKSPINFEFEQAVFDGFTPNESEKDMFNKADNELQISYLPSYWQQKTNSNATIKYKYTRQNNQTYRALVLNGFTDIEISSSTVALDKIYKGYDLKANAKQVSDMFVSLPVSVNQFCDFLNSIKKQLLGKEKGVLFLLDNETGETLPLLLINQRLSSISWNNTAKKFVPNKNIDGTKPINYVSYYGAVEFCKSEWSNNGTLPNSNVFNVENSNSSWTWCEIKKTNSKIDVVSGNIIRDFLPETMQNNISFRIAWKK